MDIELELRKLKRIAAIQGVGILLIVVWHGLTWLSGRLEEDISRVTVVRSGKGVALRTLSDRPFIVTHLAVSGWDAGSESEKRTAALPAPVASIDSSGLWIEDITKLDWRDIRGEPASVPDESTRLSALMLRPEYVVPRPEP